MTRGADLYSIAGKAGRADRRVPLVVVGAGPAGVAAATEAARAGVPVLLVDEHPLDPDLMAMDVPLVFGQRMGPAVRNRTLALERVVAANPALAAADEAGVDVQLGVMVWGAFRNGPTSRELEGPVLGLADGQRSWLVGYDRLVVAAGARDVVLGFRGWEMAGIIGANGAAALLTRYGALATRRMVVVGSGPLGLRTARLALDRGVEVAGVVEVGPAVRGDEALRRALAERGVRFDTRHTVKAAWGRVGEVEGVTLVRLDDGLQPIAGSETGIACDTIGLAVGLVPNVELLDLLGCRLHFRAERGGFVPETDAWLRTSVHDVFVAGDAGGLDEAMLVGEGPARNQGRRAGLAAAASLGALGPDRVHALAAGLRGTPATGVREDPDYWRLWLRSLVNAGGWEVNACQCEEVTRRELAAVEPPRYLGWRSAAMSARSVRTLLADGPVNQDQIKRLTRVGMGPCQGRRCREQVALLLADLAETPVAGIPLPSYRAPVRPLPLGVLWPDDEPPEMREQWTNWFGIPTQFAAHWKPIPARGAVETGDGT